MKNSPVYFNAKLRRNAQRRRETLIAGVAGAVLGILALATIESLADMPIVYEDAQGHCIRVESHRGHTCDSLPGRYQSVLVGPHYGKG